MKGSKKDPSVPSGYRWIFVKEFRHWRSGKIIKAADYGYEAFRILVGTRRKKK